MRGADENQTTATVNSGSALPLAMLQFLQASTQSLPSYMEALPAMSSTDTPWGPGGMINWHQDANTPTTTARSSPNTDSDPEISSGNEYSPRSI
jgi:hypothetical protein